MNRNEFFQFSLILILNSEIEVLKDAFESKQKLRFFPFPIQYTHIETNHSKNGIEAQC